jgi:hypothetical protein
MRGWTVIELYHTSIHDSHIACLGLLAVELHVQRQAV